MDTTNDDDMKFFYLDQRLINALKEDDIDKYLMIVREKQIEELHQKKQIIQIKEDEKKLEKEKENEEYIKMMIKKEEELFEENRMEIKKKLDERIKQRMIHEIKSIMIYQISDNILKLENRIKDALSILENSLNKSKSSIKDLYDLYEIKPKCRYTIKALTNE